MRVLALAACLALAGCSSSGGGTPAPPPNLAGATVVLQGGTPAAGDVLILQLSQDVVLTGAVLDDTDMVLSAGSLGAVAAAPVLVNARTVQITLGAGVSLVPNTAQIDFGAMNDAVQSTGGVLAESRGDGGPVIMAGDGDAPQVAQLTLNAVQDALNGTGPAGGTMQVPPNGFTIYLEHSDPTSPIATAATRLFASVNVNTSTGTVLAGTDFSDQLTLTATGAASSFSVPAAVQFPAAAAVTLTAIVTDVTGMTSDPTTFTFEVTSINDDIRPLEAGQLWFLDTSRDLESYAFGAAPTVNVIAGANGTPDLEDLYAVLGLFGSDGSVNATVRSQIQAEILARLNALFSAVNTTFTFTSPGSFPSGSSSVPYSSFSFSQMCISGAFNSTGGGGVLGLAIFDPHNETQDDDCDTSFAGNRLGVFMHTMVKAGIQSGASSTFRSTYDDLTPGLGGTAIGDDVDDAARLAGTLQDGRAMTIETAILRFARSAAFITAHECGHSMGLVPDGPMPTGLYGGDDVNFPGSSSGHIDTDALFPGNAQNVMSTGISFEGSIDADSGFNLLNLAYLRERALYDRP